MGSKKKVGRGFGKDFCKRTRKVDIRARTKKFPAAGEAYVAIF